MILIFKHKKVADKSTEQTLEMLQMELEKLEAKSDIATFDDLELYVEKDNVQAVVNGKDLREYSTVFFRRVGMFRNRAHILALLAKKNGIAFFDKLYDVTNEPGKLKQTTVLALEGVSVPKTYFSGEYIDEKINNAVNFLGLPIVAKISVSRKGQGVLLAKDINELKDIISKNYQEEILLQEFIPNSFDYRILVLGDKIACAEKRIRIDENDFRNNIALGAKEEFIDADSLSEDIRQLAINAAKKANIQIAGVDIVTSPDGNSFVFEVNRAPAFTHDKKISNEIEKLAAFLIESEKKYE